MSLSASERASLAHDLILSLDAKSDLDFGAETETEIVRRVVMVREGTAKGRSCAEVFRDIVYGFLP